MGHPGELLVTAPKETFALQRDDDDSAWNPSMCRDGSVVAAKRIRSKDPLIVAIQTYSLKEKKWTEHKQVRDLEGGIAISPDGSRIAFGVRQQQPPFPTQIYFVDLKKGTESIGPAIVRFLGTLSWSPDGGQIAYDMDQAPLSKYPETSPTIVVLDIETGRTTNVAPGVSPAWSPSGEWIAYLDSSRHWEVRWLKDGWYEPPWEDRVSMVRTDGTGSKTLVTLGEDRILGILFPVHRLFRFAPVWSPDSTKLLLNEYADWDRFTFDIHLLDLSTLKLTRKFKRTVPVYGWAVASKANGQR